MSAPVCCFVRIDGFVLRVEREGQRLRLVPSDEHDRNELLRYLASALTNPELMRNLLDLKSERSTPVLWYYPIQPGEFAKWTSTVEFQRVRADYEHCRGAALAEPVWTYKFVPTMQLSAFVAHSSVLRLLKVSEAVAAGHTEFAEGVEVYSEDEWANQFDHARQKGLLMPSLLNELEQSARRYAALFDDGARDYTPDEAEFWRGELLKKLANARLINCTIAPTIFAQLGKHPHLGRVVNTAEYLRSHLDLGAQKVPIQDCPVSLDFMMFDPDFPKDLSLWDGLHFCLSTVEAARLDQPRSLPMEIGRQQYRLVTGWDNGRIKLLHAIELNSELVIFKDVYKATYLELLAWASLARDGSPAMEWDVVVNWDDWIGTLADFSADPTLPEADYLRHCIYCHLAGLRVHERRKMLDIADGMLKHADAAVRRIGERTHALASGKLDFVYNDWCSGGFNRKDRAERQGKTRRRN